MISTGVLVQGLVAAAVLLAATGSARAQSGPAQAPEELTHEGYVRGVDSSRKELTLMDGTKLVVLPGASLRPEVLPQGTGIVLRYKVLGGKKVLTAVSVAEPSPGLLTGDPSTPRPAD